MGLAGPGYEGRSLANDSAEVGSSDGSGCFSEQIGLDELVQPSVENGLRVALLDVCPVVLDELVGMENVASHGVAAEARVGHLAPLARQLLLPPLLLGLDHA